jgi:hypothetical protein
MSTNRARLVYERLPSPSARWFEMDVLAGPFGGAGAATVRGATRPGGNMSQHRSVGHPGDEC